MNKVICIIGRTCSGKDTIAKYLQKEYGVEPVVSYTTRKIRPSEKNGREHYFVTPEEFKDILETKEIIAYTKFNDTEYCATLDSLDTSGIKSYIIDPNGVKFLKDNFSDRIDIITIFIDTSNKNIITRALKRGDRIEDVLKRSKNETAMFENYKNSGAYDYLIDGNLSKEEVQNKVKEIMEGIQ